MIEVTFFPGRITNTANGQTWQGAFDELAAYLRSKATDTDQKGSAGYWVAAAIPSGQKRADASCEPTNVVAIDYDDSPEGPDWALLRPYAYVAHTTDTHERPDSKGWVGPHWRVWLELEATAAGPDLRAAQCPWPGAHLRSISQPAYVPTRPDTQWRVNPGRALGLSREWGVVKPTTLAREPRPVAAGAVAGALPWDEASVTEMFARDEHTNLKAGGCGRVLYRFGFTAEFAREYVYGVLARLGHPHAARHAASAAAACAPLSTAWGIPSLVREGVVFLGQERSEVEVAAPLTLRRNPDDRARPWWIWSADVGVWAKATDGAAAAHVHTTPLLGPMLDGLPTAKRVRTRNALLADHERYELTVSALDTDPNTLAVPSQGGALVVDLRSGARHVASPEDACSRVCAVTPVTATAAIERVMLDWADGDAALADYLWAVSSYAATGTAREKALWVFYGPADAGKSTFVEHIAACLGSYAVTVPIDTWLSGTRKNDADESLGRISANTRLVISPELPQDRKFDVSRVTAFTGGDTLTAAGKWKSEQEFVPRAKLWIAGNHPPTTKTYSAAFASRLHIVPFVRVFERSHAFKETLVGLRGETLGRLVAGAERYLKHGLPAVPKAVADATLEVVAESDAFGQWLLVKAEATAFAGTTALHQAWVRESPMSHIKTITAFAREMRRFPQFVKATKRVNGQLLGGYLGLTA